MPAYCNPDAKVPVVLDIDKEQKPQPTFWIRVLTERQAIELGDDVDRWLDAPMQNNEIGIEWMHSEGRKLLAQHVIGWDAMPEGFTLDNLRYAELRELLMKVLASIGLNAVQKKDCELQHLCALESCAEAVA